MLDGDARVYVEDFRNLVLRTSGLERGAANEEPPPLYWDPKLRAWQKAYREFIVTLEDASVVVESPREALPEPYVCLRCPEQPAGGAPLRLAG